MKLDFDTIRRIAFGAVEVTSDENGIRFHKCTQKQRAAWQALSPELGANATATTGVRLDFWTDSSAFAFRAVGNRFEVYVNGLPVGRFQWTAQRQEVRAKIDLGPAGEEKRVTLIFPSHKPAGILKEAELDDGAKVRPYTYAQKLLFLGDSITQGWNSGYDSLSYAWRTARFFDADCLIQGVGGGVFHESTLDTLPFDPDAVIVAYGTNDFFIGLFKDTQALYGHMRACLDGLTARYGQKPRFLITPTWREDEDRPQKLGNFSDYRRILKTEAEARGFAVIDGPALVPHDSTYYFDKVLHPNEMGFGIYAENLIRAMLLTKKIAL